MCACCGLFCHSVLPGHHADARLPQRDQIMIFRGSLRRGCRCREGGGWSASIALTFTTEIHHSWRQQMRRSCQFGVSHSTMPETSHSIKCSPTCCLPNDTEESLLVYYPKSTWFKATNLSCCQVLREGVHHCNLCIAVIKSSSVSRDVLPLWSGTLMWPGQAFGELLVYPRYWFSSPVASPLPQVTFKPDLSTAEVHDENIKGPLKVRQERWRRLMLSHGQLWTLS